MSAPIVTVEAMFDAVRRKDLQNVPFADNIQYEGPLMPELHGRDHVIRFLGSYLAAVKGFEIVRHIADGEFVATVLNVDTMFAPLSMVFICRVQEDRIVDLRLYYDPRPFVEGMGAA